MMGCYRLLRISGCAPEPPAVRSRAYIITTGVPEVTLGQAIFHCQPITSVMTVMLRHGPNFKFKTHVGDHARAIPSRSNVLAGLGLHLCRAAYAFCMLSLGCTQEVFSAFFKGRSSLTHCIRTEGTGA